MHRISPRPKLTNARWDNARLERASFNDAVGAPRKSAAEDKQGTSTKA
jgi:hypothetical protein